MTKQIIITGPESSGKTTLAKTLALHYDVPLVKEYAREYLEQLERDYTFEDVILMAKEQLKQEQELADSFSICDTDLTVFHVWIKEKYNKELDWINQHIAQAQNKIYLLCDVDIPWEEDDLREHPNIEDRKRLFNEYKQLLEFYNLTYYVISGDKKNRQKKCIEIIDSLI